MSNVSQLPSIDERKTKRRLHLREISQDAELPSTSVGATLRAARIERDQDVAAVAGALKMRREQVEAIEEDDFSKLPGHAYTLGFIRSYARFVGLDADELIQQFKDESADQEACQPVQLVFPEAPETKRLPNVSVLILALAIAMVIYAISYVTMPGRKSPQTAKAEESAVVVVEPGQVAPEKPAAVAAPAQPVTALVPTPPPAPAVEAAAPPTVFVAGTTDLPAPALPASLTPMTDTAPIVVADATTAPAATQTAPQPAVDGSRIALTALEPTYVRMRDPRVTGAKGILLDRILATGESFHVPDRAGLIMQTGNAGGLQVAVDGRGVGVLGKRGEVITRIPVDPSYFLERLAAPQ